MHIVRRSVLSDKINGTYRKSRPLYYTHTQFPRYYICNFRCTLGQPPTMHARARARRRARRRRRRRFFLLAALKPSRAQDPPLYCPCRVHPTRTIDIEHHSQKVNLSLTLRVHASSTTSAHHLGKHEAKLATLEIMVRAIRTRKIWPLASPRVLPKSLPNP